MRTVREDPRLPALLSDPNARTALWDVLREFGSAINDAAAGRLSLFVSVTGTYSAGVNDHIILVAPAAICTITLPTVANMRNKRIIVKRSNSTTHVITVNTVAGNIDGAASVTLTTAYQSREFFSDGVNFWTV